MTAIRDFVRSIRIGIGGLILEAWSAADGPLLTVEGPSRLFVTTEGEPDLRVEVTWADLSSEENPGDLVFDSGGTWRLYRSGNVRVFRFFSSNCGPISYEELRWAENGADARLRLHRSFFPSDQPIDALQFPLDEVISMHLLGGGKGAEFHSCGILSASESGYLFAGQSGDGKTTTAGLWLPRQGVHVLSDDRIIVRHEGDRFYMYGTPWHGTAELAENLEVPIRAIFLLERGPENTFHPLSVAEAATALFARSFVPFHDVDAVNWTLGFVGELARKVPCQRFAFAPDERAVEAVLKAYP